jgi:hypothetical protein
LQVTLAREARNEFLPFLSSAFPALRVLELHDVNLGAAALLCSLAACSQLQELKLNDCSIDPPAVQPATALLARLPSLVSLSLDETLWELAAQLTNLTSLSLRMFLSHGHLDILSVIPATPSLLALSIEAFEWNGSNQASQLQRLLACCPSLTHLDMGFLHLGQQGLDVLLQQGTHVTSLSVAGIKPTECRRRSACRWKKLSVQWPSLAAAYLPLQAVEQLVGFDCLSLYKLGDGIDAAASLHQAASNLAACPAWEHTPPAALQLIDCKADMSALGLLRSLGPLHAVQFKGFKIDYPGQLGASEVQALRTSLGNGLQQLTLTCATLNTGFWQALPEHLPGLQHLWLGSRVAASGAAISIFCRSAPSPLTLHLRTRLWDRLQGVQLRACLTAWGINHVVIQEWPTAM